MSRWAQNDTLGTNQEVSLTFLHPSIKRTTLNRVRSLLDTGSPVSFISDTVVPARLLRPLSATECCSMVKGPLYSRGRINCTIQFRGHSVRHSFIILTGITWPVIIGRDLLNSLNIFHTYSSFLTSCITKPPLTEFKEVDTILPEKLEDAIRSICSLDVVEAENELT